MDRTFSWDENENDKQNFSLLNVLEHFKEYETSEKIK
jgi:hypothetical protein